MTTNSSFHLTPKTAQKAAQQSGGLCLITAADIEFNQAVKALPRPLIGRELGIRTGRAINADLPVTVLQSEMGAPDFTDRLLRHLEIFHYEHVVVLGLAGGLSPELKPGDVIIYEQCELASNDALVAKKPRARDEFASIRCDNKVVSWLTLRCGQAFRVVRGKGIQTAEVLTTTIEKSALFQTSAALAVDMESWSILDKLNRHQIPVTACRVIVDGAADDLPQFNHGLRADGSYDAFQMIGVMLKRPVVSMRFLWNLRKATATLHRIAQVLALDSSPNSRSF